MPQEEEGSVEVLFKANHANFAMGSGFMGAADFEDVIVGLPDFEATDGKVNEQHK